jgi:hypothetical protein
MFTPNKHKEKGKEIILRGFDFEAFKLQMVA